MIGVVCAGGRGTRLYPLTYATNKHLLPIYDQPMIYYPLQTLLDAGIRDVVIVVGGEHAGAFIKVIKNGKELGFNHVYYAYQEGDRAGIADAVLQAEGFANGEAITVILGDNTTDADISDDVQNFEKGAKIFLKEVPDPERFGCPVFDPDQQIIKIEEKPKSPQSRYGVVGLYIYDNTVFDKIKKLKPSKRGELEITDLNNMYLKDGGLDYSMLTGFWRDAGTFDTLSESNAYWKLKNNK
ncbi:MAG: Glucose-1-phosphate thymidylyltransferase [Elusimicrobia bacterium]|nr:Glucose-1-phosphate thymidylyltransferase [Elusimicrobiota bacterium]